MNKPLILALSLSALTLVGCAATATAPTPLPVAAASSSPAPVPGYDWFFDADGGEPSLTYGVESSDDVQLALSCRPGQDKIDVLTTAAHGVRDIHLESGGDTERLSATAEPSPSSDTDFLSATASTTSPVFQRFRRLGWLALLHGDARTLMVPQPGSTSRIASFFAACG